MSDELKQGEKYEDTLSNLEDEKNNTEAKSSSSKGGIQSLLDTIKEKKIFILIGAAIILIIIIAIMLPQGVTTTEDSFINDLINGDGTVDEDWVMFEYSDAEIQELRAYGYTADEIEREEQLGTSASYLISLAMTAQEEKQKEAWERLMDSTSEEYQALLDKTWLGGEEFTLNALPEGSFYQTEQIVYNADYIKLPEQGNQLFLRVTLENGSYMFMTVHPERWVTLKDEGNIVVSYTVVTYNGVQIITSIAEVLQ